MKPNELPKNSDEERKPFTSCLKAAGCNQDPHSTYSSSVALRNVAAQRNISPDKTKQDIHFISLVLTSKLNSSEY